MDGFLRFLKYHYRRSPVTTVLIVLNTIMVLIVMLSGGFNIFNLVRFGGLLPALVFQNQEYLRLILAMFLHGSFLHFLFNSYFTYYLGSYTERLIGSKKYAIIYFLSGLGSSLFVLFLGQPNVVTIGASGALYGIMGTLLLLTYRKPEWFHPLQIRNIRSIALINLIFTFLMPNISVLGHLGGFAVGVALAYFLSPGQKGFPKQSSTGSRYFYKDDKNVINHDEIDDDDLLH